MDKQTFIFGGFEYTINIRKEFDYEPRRKSARCYVYNEADDWSAKDDAELTSTAQALGLDNVYTQRDAYPAMDKAWDKFNRKIVKRKTVDLKVALGHLGNTLPGGESTKPEFSRYAGCGCGCSPGFILKGVDPNIVLSITVKKEGA